MCQADLYAAKRILEAKRCVWDFAWQDDTEGAPAPNPPDTKRDDGSLALDSAIRSAILGGAVEYNEILTTKAYKGLLKKHLGYCREVSASRTLKYRARVYDNQRQDYRKFPKIQFVIIDEEEVIFMSSGYEHCFAIRNKKTASVFVKYAHLAWDQADEWKIGCKDAIQNGAIVDGFELFLEPAGEPARALPQADPQQTFVEGLSKVSQLEE